MEMDFSMRLPGYEEILERWRRREKELAEDADQEKRWMADALSRYRRSSRLALTWGWLFERIFYPLKTGSLGEADEIASEIVNDVLAEKAADFSGEIEGGCDLMLNRLQWAKDWDLVRLHFDYPVLEEVFCRSYWLGHFVFDRDDLIKKEENRPTLKRWMCCQRENSACAKDIRKIWCYIMKGNLERVLGKKAKADSFWRYFSDLDEFVEGCDSWKEFSMQLLLATYSDAWCQQREESLAVRSVLRKKLSQLAADGEELLAVFFRTINFNENMLEEIRELAGIYGEMPQIDQAELNNWADRQIIEGINWEEGSFWSGRPDGLYPVCLWIAEHWKVTDRTESEKCILQKYLLHMASEEELLFLGSRGFFPVRLIRPLIDYARCGEGYEKLPILIQWLHC